ncbi:hypothetical protein Tco_0496649 [Tanacetum coccineum]
MHGRYEMPLIGEMKFFLGLQIHQSPRGIFINQDKYTLEILKTHGMEKGQSIGIPMATKTKLDADLSGEPVDQTDYRSKIRSLMYLTSSRPNIVQVVCYCARYQARPTEKYLKEVKRIFRYLRAFHPPIARSCRLRYTRQSTSGEYQFLEAKYVALSASCAQVMWMRTQLQDYGFNYNKILLYCDSQSAIAISLQPVLCKALRTANLISSTVDCLTLKTTSWYPSDANALPLPSHSEFSQRKLVSFVTEINMTSIDFLTPS